MRLARFALVSLFIGSVAISQQYVISTVAGGAPIPTPIAATSASIGDPDSIAVSPVGDVYFTGYGHSVYKIDSRSNLTRVAGNGRGGFSGDGGPANVAQLNLPRGLAVDALGNLYIADTLNNRVRKVASSGIITTVAGNGTTGFSGDGGPGTRAQLYFPQGVNVDGSGNLYIADTANHRIRQLAASGVITTIAGNGSEGFSGDGNLATTARLRYPRAVAPDPGGNLYIADTLNRRIRRVTPNGNISTVSGDGTLGDSGDGGPAGSAQIGYPVGVTVDTLGNLYFVDEYYHRIRKIATNGNITTILGNGLNGYSGDGGQATAAQMAYGTGIALDSIGNLYVADTGNKRVRKVASSGIITTVAGNGTTGFSGDGGPAITAQLNDPRSVATDAAGTLYIGESDNHRIRKVAVDGTISTIAGNGSSPIAADRGGNVYAADAFQILKIAANGIITIVAGDGGQGFSGDGGQATAARLNGPTSLAIDSNGNLYLADGRNNRIRKVALNGIITTVAGNGSEGDSGDGGQATAAQLGYVSDIAIDATGTLYISQTQNHRVRKVSPDGIITTVAGNGFPGYSGDGGTATAARLNEPSALAVDAAGNLYIGDTVNNRIRRVAANGIITTIAGTGEFGYSGDGGPATGAQLRATGLVFDGSGNLYVADRENKAVRMLRPPALPLSASAVTNAASNLTSSVSPGEIVVIYGSGIGPAQLVQARVDAQGRYGTTLAGTRVLFNGTPAPILYSWATQTSAIVPYNLSGTAVSVQVEYQGAKAAPVSASVAASSPGVFTLDATGKGQAAAVNEDGSLNTASRPAKTGSIVSLYATGEGQTTPTGRDGEPVAPPLPKPVLRVQVTIDGKPAEVLYAGGAPGIVAGLMQINARIPVNAQAGAAPVVVTVGSASSQSGVTVAIAGN